MIIVQGEKSFLKTLFQVGMDCKKDRNLARIRKLNLSYHNDYKRIVHVLKALALLTRFPRLQIYL